MGPTLCSLFFMKDEEGGFWDEGRGDWAFKDAQMNAGAFPMSYVVGVCLQVLLPDSISLTVVEVLQSTEHSEAPLVQLGWVTALLLLDLLQTLENTVQGQLPQIAQNTAQAEQ